MTKLAFNPPGPKRQLGFHQLLVAARKTVLISGLREALAQVDPCLLKTQLMDYVPSDVMKILAAAGIRDEEVFPTPAVLEASPTLVGYYRLLLGAPQKSFYGGETKLGVVKSMETNDSLTERQRDALPAFCRAMSVPLADLVRQLSPTITPEDVRELPLITLGAQFQGGNNNTIGKQATSGIFRVILELVAPYINKRSETKVTVLNSAGRKVEIVLSSDPDVGISEEFDGFMRRKVAIEIKGGTDKSNAHNRAGEAEKSHQKAKSEGYREFWTIIAMKGLDGLILAQESPTTASWYDVAQVLGQEGADWDEFRSRLADVVGIPIVGP